MMWAVSSPKAAQIKVSEISSHKWNWIFFREEKFPSLNNMMEFDIFPSLQNSGQYLIILDTVWLYHRRMFSFSPTSKHPRVLQDPFFLSIPLHFEGEIHVYRKNIQQDSDVKREITWPAKRHLTWMEGNFFANKNVMKRVWKMMRRIETYGYVSQQDVLGKFSLRENPPFDLMLLHI